jgi:hypothetical protein
MVAPLVPMVAPLVPCRALSLSHTQAWAAGGDLRTRIARGDGLCCMVGYGGF